MTVNQLPEALSGAQSTFKLLKEWRESKEAQKLYFHQADGILQDNADEIRQMKHQNSENRGKEISKAGASGIDVSSFNDAFLSQDLKNVQEIYDKQKQAQEKAEYLRKQSRNERRNRRNRAFSYSIGLLSDLSGLGF